MRWWLVLFCLWAAGAEAKPLVADLSQHGIAIDSGFTGMSVLAFGAQGEPGQVVVVVRGPEANVTVGKKERRGGMWMIVEQSELRNVPAFYAIASTKPLTEIADEGLRRRFGLGVQGLEIAGPEPVPDHARDAYFKERAGKGLYLMEPKPITFMGETLFKTAIYFPEKIPRGEYTAEVYLLRDGVVTAMQSTPLMVNKEGMDAFIYDLAHHYPMFYGIVSVLIALSFGWVASVAFRK